MFNWLSRTGSGDSSEGHRRTEKKTESWRPTWAALQGSIPKQRQWKLQTNTKRTKITISEIRKIKREKSTEEASAELWSLKDKAQMEKNWCCNSTKLRHRGEDFPKWVFSEEHWDNSGTGHGLLLGQLKDNEQLPPGLSSDAADFRMCPWIKMVSLWLMVEVHPRESPKVGAKAATGVSLLPISIPLSNWETRPLQSEFRFTARKRGFFS